MDDKTIEVTDYLLSKSETYREAQILAKKLFKKVTREIELRALEKKIY
ncbi:hypothetical protein [Streptococcus sp. NLN64]|nr:hypothetical protein [Streptococcus sp. NLN64]MBG9366527.1 hypothetical protein [Streptococcus sp. NLN64]